MTTLSLHLFAKPLTFLNAPERSFWNWRHTSMRNKEQGSCVFTRVLNSAGHGVLDIFQAAGLRCGGCLYRPNTPWRLKGRLCCCLARRKATQTQRPRQVHCSPRLIYGARNGTVLTVGVRVRRSDNAVCLVQHTVEEGVVVNVPPLLLLSLG